MDRKYALDLIRGGDASKRYEYSRHEDEIFAEYGEDPELMFELAMRHAWVDRISPKLKEDVGFVLKIAMLDGFVLNRLLPPDSRFWDNDTIARAALSAGNKLIENPGLDLLCGYSERIRDTKSIVLQAIVNGSFPEHASERLQKDPDVIKADEVRRAIIREKKREIEGQRKKEDSQEAE